MTRGQYIIYLGKDLEGYLWSEFSTYRLGSPRAEKEKGMGKRPSFGPWPAETSVAGEIKLAVGYRMLPNHKLSSGG